MEAAPTGKLMIIMSLAPKKSKSGSGLSTLILREVGKS